jgi:hypothetical protein
MEERKIFFVFSPSHYPKEFLFYFPRVVSVGSWKLKRRRVTAQDTGRGEGFS